MPKPKAAGAKAPQPAQEEEAGEIDHNDRHVKGTQHPWALSCCRWQALGSVPVAPLIPIPLAANCPPSPAMGLSYMLLACCCLHVVVQPLTLHACPGAVHSQRLRLRRSPPMRVARPPRRSATTTRECAFR